MNKNSTAFGAPGIEPRWTSSAKDGVGTAYYSASSIWFTLSHGIINEIYFPHVDTPNTRRARLVSRRRWRAWSALDAARRKACSLRMPKHWELLGKVEWLVVDKTGTLTEGHPQLVDSDIAKTKGVRQIMIQPNLLAWLNRYPIEKYARKIGLPLCDVFQSRSGMSASLKTPPGGASRHHVQIRHLREDARSSSTTSRSRRT